MDFFQELKDVTAALDASEVDYALCGGVALAIHGVPRATQDIDLLVQPEDLPRLREVARTCGFVLESFPMDFASGITIQRFTKPIDGPMATGLCFLSQAKGSGGISLSA